MSNFTFKFDETNMNMSETLSQQLVLASSDPDTMNGNLLIAEAHKNVVSRCC